ncbi:MAG TPA: LytTR family DNA-binding domain-containing protein [Gemmatimonadaceae bacterium]
MRRSAPEREPLAGEAPVLRALVVDDEPLARAHLRKLLAADPEVEVTGECGNGRDAVAAILEQAPDLVFLDIQMPELDGFEVVRQVGTSRMPAVVFVTAYDAYALRAFDVNALAYLLKPVDRERFAAVLERAKALARRPAASSELESRLAALLEQTGDRGHAEDRLAIKVEGRIIFVRIGDIDWVEAHDNHVRLHVGPRTHVVRGTLTALERRLPAPRFLRAHRSAMVNIDRIAEVQPWFGGDYVLILTNGTRVTSGRTYRDRVQEFLRKSL